MSDDYFRRMFFWSFRFVIILYRLHQRCVRLNARALASYRVSFKPTWCITKTTFVSSCPHWLQEVVFWKERASNYNSCCLEGKQAIVSCQCRHIWGILLGALSSANKKSTTGFLFSFTALFGCWWHFPAIVDETDSSSGYAWNPR